MDQLSGVLTLVAADGLARLAVDVGQSIEPAPNQDRVHGRGAQAQPIGDLDRSESVLPAQMDDLSDHRLWGAIGLMMRR